MTSKTKASGDAGSKGASRKIREKAIAAEVAVESVAPRKRPPAAAGKPPKKAAANRGKPAVETIASALPPSPEALALSPDQRERLEKLSANLARAALTAQGALAEAALRQADRPAALTPDPFHVGPALTEVMSRLAAQPDKMMRAQANLFSRYMDLWHAAARRMAGDSSNPAIVPAKGDKRFLDPDWSVNPLFDIMKQSYLLTSNWLNDLVSEVEGVDPMNKRRVEFFMKMLTDAFSPSNFLISNPAALREIATTQGQPTGRRSLIGRAARRWHLTSSN